MSMTHRMGPKGQVVIPREMRDVLGMSPGDEVDFVLEQGSVRVELHRAQNSLRGAFAGSALLEDLEDDRRAERDRQV